MRDISYKSEGVTYERLWAKITSDLMECWKIPPGFQIRCRPRHVRVPTTRPDRRPTSDVRRVCSSLNKSGFPLHGHALIQEISFYFIYGHNVQRGFLLARYLLHFYWPLRISIIYFSSTSHASFHVPRSTYLLIVRFDSLGKLSIARSLRWRLQSNASSAPIYQ